MKKLYKIIFLLTFFVFIFFLNSTISKASVSSNDPTASVNSDVSITITSSTPVESFKISLSNAEGLTFEGVSGDGNLIINGSNISYAGVGSNKTTLATYKFKTPNAVGKYKVTFDVTADTNKTTNTSTVTVIEQNSGTVDNSNSTNSTSSIATLANLGIRPNDFSGFKATKTSYSTDVPNNVESVEIYATKGQSGQSISGTGKKALKEGSNTFNIVVTAEDGKTKKTYTLTINRKSNTDTENTVTNTTSNDTVNEMANNTEENEIIDDTNEVNNSINNIVENNNENKNALSLQTKNIIIIAAIAIIIIIIIIIIAVEKNKKDNEYYDLLDDNKNNNEDKDFDTSSMPVALQNKEDNNSENNDDNDLTDDYSPKVKDEELEPNNKDKNSKLEEMFEDVENEKLKHKPHYKGRRFK